MKKLAVSFISLLIFTTIFSTATAQTNYNLEPLTGFGPNGDGSLRPGDRDYLTSTAGNGQGDNLQRGIGYNPVTDHILLVSRTNSPTLKGIYILDATTGVEVGTLNTNGIPPGTNGGTFVLSKIAVADDGVIYAANFGGFPGTTNTVYRWSNESAVPTIAFAGDPSAGTTNRSWGTTLDVRGAGPNTQILMGSQGTVASILTTTDGTNFTANVINTDAFPGDFEHGCVFGHGNSFWGKAINRALRLFSFDFNAGTASTIRGYYTNEIPASLSLGQMAFDPSRDIVAFLDVVPGTDHMRLYDVSNPNIPPVLLEIKDFAVDNNNTNFAGALDFGGGRLFALDCNNGIQAFSVTSNAMSLPAIIADPASQEAPVNSDAYFTVYAYRGVTYQWQHEGTDIPGATNVSLVVSNAQLTDGGNYQVIVGNSAGSVPSATATLTITFPDNATHLNPLWSLAPLSRAYLPADTGGVSGPTPLYRSLAYNVLSNHLYIVSRTGANAGLSVNVLNATTGADLYKLNTNGISPLAVSANSIILMMIGVAEDGAIYAGNMAYSGGSTPAVFRLYRWANADSNTVPVLVFSGEPAGVTNVLRWGDTLAVRGAGTNTQILIDNQNSVAPYIVVFRPTDATMASFTPTAFAISNGFSTTVIGRSIQFGVGNTCWQKRTGSPLFESGFDFAESVTTPLHTNDAIFAGMGPLGIDFTNHLLAGILFASAGALDTLDLYEFSDPNNPVLLASYPFPVNHVNNGNFIGQVLFAGGRVFALNGNNGIMAMTLAPQVIPRLEIVRSGSNVVLSWTNSVSGFQLRRTTSLSPIAWEDVTNSVTVDNRQYNVTDDTSAASSFYRLRK